MVKMLITLSEVMLVSFPIKRGLHPATLLCQESTESRLLEFHSPNIYRLYILKCHHLHHLMYTGILRTVNASGTTVCVAQTKAGLSCVCTKWVTRPYTLNPTTTQGVRFL